MITEDYVSFEIAKLLKEKGFDEPLVNYYYTAKGERVGYFLMPEVQYLCPTHQMAMKWLREVHNICIIIEPHAYDYINEKNASYACSLWQGDNYYEYLLKKAFSSYEETVETALKYSLENLI